MIAEFEKSPQSRADHFTAKKVQVAANRAFCAEQLIFGAGLQPQLLPTGMCKKCIQGTIEKFCRIRAAQIEKLQPNPGLLLEFLDKKLLEQSSGFEWSHRSGAASAKIPAMCRRWPQSGKSHRRPGRTIDRHNLRRSASFSGSHLAPS